ncbi:hypothetical protein [Globicatella sanguinis]|uniref:hypothetical protein n=1 Tax=Globicatella sanguinis TaxID=13076 RepID=UPI000826ACF8|nr:hypothetical protein [Globicatella sanguinis]
MKKEMLKLNLQMFAEPEVEEASTQSEGAETVEEVAKVTFTQDEFNSKMAERANRAENDLLKSLGVTSKEDLQQALAEFQEFKDSQKTETEKKDEQVKALIDEKTQLQTDYDNLKAQVEAMKLGVKDDSIEEVIQLANLKVTDEVTLTEAMKQVIEKFPMFTGTSEQAPEKKPTFVNPVNPKTDGGEVDAFTKAFKKFK